MHRRRMAMQLSKPRLRTPRISLGALRWSGMFNAASPRNDLSASQWSYMRAIGAGIAICAVAWLLIATVMIGTSYTNIGARLGIHVGQTLERRIEKFRALRGVYCRSHTEIEGISMGGVTLHSMPKIDTRFAGTYVKTTDRSVFFRTDEGLVIREDDELWSVLSVSFLDTIETLIRQKRIELAVESAKRAVVDSLNQAREDSVRGAVYRRMEAIAFTGMRQ